MADGCCWSAVGASAEQESRKFTDKQDASVLHAGLMWHTVTRKSVQHTLEAEVTSFVPLEHPAEVMRVTLRNTGSADTDACGGCADFWQKRGQCS